MIASVLILVIGGVFLGLLASKLFAVLAILPVWLLVAITVREEGERRSQIARLLTSAVLLTLGSLLWTQIVIGFVRSRIASGHGNSAWLLWTIALMVSCFPVANLLENGPAREEEYPVLVAAVLTTIAFFVFLFVPKLALWP